MSLMLQKLLATNPTLTNRTSRTSTLQKDDWHGKAETKYGTKDGYRRYTPNK